MMLFLSYYLASFATLWNPTLNSLLAIGLLCLFAYAIRKDIALGFILMLVNTILGSFGYEYVIAIGGIHISLRIALFALFIVSLVLQKQFWNKLLLEIKKTSIQLWILFYAALAGSVIHAFVRGNSISLIFGDANNYVFYTLIPLLLIYKNEIFKKGIALIQKSWLAMTILSALCVYIFSHNFGKLNSFLYTWIRDARIGEVTRVSLDSEFHRVFFQTHSIALVFVAVAVYALIVHAKTLREYILQSLFLSLGFFILLLSFSRSLWLGLAGMGLFYVVFLIKQQLVALDLKRLLYTILSTLGAVVISVLMLFTLVLFPYPQGGAFSLDDIKNRASSLGDDAASSRWNLRAPLEELLTENYLFGSGFGTTVTYQSNDPRIKNANNPEGWVTTSSFEWGFHDMVSEYGILGLFILALAMLYTLRELNAGAITYSVLCALIITHIFTPYLNHPLGITAILVAILYEGSYRRHQIADSHSQSQLLA